MIKTLFHLLKGGNATPAGMFPSLPPYSRGLPMVTDAPCDGCQACVAACPTQAITADGGRVTLDRGQCLACGACTTACPTGTLVPDRRTDVAVRDRAALVQTNDPAAALPPPPPPRSEFRRSLHVRVVSAADSASDLEVTAANNPIFDASRFGVHVVASPRFADALLVTGPVARAMREPLRRCYEAMAEPRLVIAVGAAAISGVPYRGGYAQADGVGAVLPVAAFVPGHPPHPWYILHGLLLAMGRAERGRGEWG